MLQICLTLRGGSKSQYSNMQCPFFSSRSVPVWLVMKDVSVSSVLSVWLKRAMGLAPWKSRMLGTATVPNLVERLVEDGNRHDIEFTVNSVYYCFL